MYDLCFWNECSKVIQEDNVPKIKYGTCGTLGTLLHLKMPQKVLKTRFLNVFSASF